MRHSTFIVVLASLMIFSSAAIAQTGTLPPLPSPVKTPQGGGLPPLPPPPGTSSITIPPPSSDLKPLPDDSAGEEENFDDEEMESAAPPAPKKTTVPLPPKRSPALTAKSKPLPSSTKTTSKAVIGKTPTAQDVFDEGVDAAPVEPPFSDSIYKQGYNRGLGMAGMPVNQHYNRMIFQLAAKNDLNAVRAFADSGYDILAIRNDDGDTLLMHAVRNQAVTIVQYLLVIRADVKTTNRYGFTALHIAAFVGNNQLTQMLLQAKADPNAADFKGVTPLIYASLSRNINNVILLLDFKADPNRQTEDGLTALHFAARAGQREVVRLLAARGAKKELTDKNGYTASMLAAFAGHQDIANFLR